MRLLGAPGAAALASSILFGTLTFAQTYSTCNPLEQSCPADPALGSSTQIDFSSGPSRDFTPTGNTVTYNSDGAQLTVAGSGDNPTLSSKWYIMFGHVDFTFKAAPGVGMVSSAILISDALDEIDWELLGSDASQAQTNYFGKGITGTYDRGTFVSAPASQTEFNTYSIDWTSERIEFQLNGVTVRTVYASDAGSEYPQTPMQVKVGSWAGGDASNSDGTIKWAGGPINYYDGPFVMQVQSISVTDYSTGSAYQYSGTDGSWGQVQAIGGSVNSGGGESAPPAYAPPVAGSGATTGSYSLAGSPTAPASSSYLTSLGYDLSSATSARHQHSTDSPAPSSPPSRPGSGGCETLIEYDQKGFLYTMTAPTGWKKTYNNQGVLVTPPPCTSAAPATTQAGAIAAAPTTLAVVTTPVDRPGPTQIAIPTNATTSGPSAPPFPGKASGRTTGTLSVAAAVCAVAGFAIFL